MTEDPLADIVLDQYQKLNEEQESPIIPTMHPLAVGDVLLMRTVRICWRWISTRASACGKFRLRTSPTSAVEWRRMMFSSRGN